MIARGSLIWADLGRVRESMPAKLRPVLVVQGDRYNVSGLSTVVVLSISSNTALAELPGNVFVPASASGLPKDSSINVSQFVTLNEFDLGESVGALPTYLMSQVDAGLRKVLAL